MTFCRAEEHFNTLIDAQDVFVNFFERDEFF